MNTVGKVVTVAAVGGAGYLVYDYFASQGSTGASGVSLVESGIAGVRNALPASLGGATATKVATPYPSIQLARVDPFMEGAAGNTAVFGLSSMADDICGIGSGAIVSALASCETTTDAERLACYNCNLFNMTISAADIAAGKKHFMVGNKKCRDFLTGETSQVEGFKSCLRAFKAWLDAHCPNAIAPMRSGDFNAFTIEFAQAWAVNAFKRDIVNGTVAHSTLRTRYYLLLLHNKAPAIA